MTVDSRTLTTNYNVADNSIGAQELWLRGGFEWALNNDITIKNQVYDYSAQRHWIDSETYAFDLATSTIDRDRFFVSHNQHVIGDNTDLTWNSSFFGMENRFAGSACRSAATTSRSPRKAIRTLTRSTRFPCSIRLPASTAGWQPDIRNSHLEHFRGIDRRPYQDHSDVRADRRRQSR